MGAKNRTEADETSAGTGAWMVTFSDLIMLMLTFFVLLLSMSSLNQKTVKELFDRLQESTGVLEFSGYGKIQSLDAFVKRYLSSENKIVIDQNRLLDMFLPNAEEIRKLQQEIGENGEQINIYDDGRGLVMSFHDNILFEPGRTEIRKASLPFLDAVSVAIANSANEIFIMGHADVTPVGNTAYESNWELSAYRGLAVLGYFLKEKKLPPERFRAGGYGSSRPLKPNDTSADRAMNRRVEIIFKHIGEM